MSYTVESYTEKIIHNANEEIVVGLNNDQLITGKKTFASANFKNTGGTIYIGTDSNNKGAFELSAESDHDGDRGYLKCKNSIEF